MPSDAPLDPSVPLAITSSSPALQAFSSAPITNDDLTPAFAPNHVTIGNLPT